MAKVLILLSTYNGEKFLPEQLDSLYCQKGVECHLLVRDDSSKDATVSILEDYKNRHGRMAIIQGENLGAGGSFMALINEAATHFANFDYYAFCDQDDVWFEHKIETGVKALEKSSERMKLFFSGAINTDRNLQPITSSCVRLVNSFGANLVANHILGCTMLMNGALLQQINKINTKPFSIPNGVVPIHDAWTAIVAYSLDADVIQSLSGLMYYRQHGHNAIGAGHGFWSIQKNRIMRYLGGATHGKANKCIIALQVLGDEIPTQNRILLQKVANYRASFKSKLGLLFDKRMYEYGIVDNLGTILTILFNKF